MKRGLTRLHVNYLGTSHQTCRNNTDYKFSCWNTEMDSNLAFRSNFQCTGDVGAERTKAKIPTGKQRVRSRMRDILQDSKSVASKGNKGEAWLTLLPPQLSPQWPQWTVPVHVGRAHRGRLVLPAPLPQASFWYPRHAFSHWAEQPRSNPWRVRIPTFGWEIRLSQSIPCRIQTQLPTVITCSSVHLLLASSNLSSSFIFAS